MALNHDERRLVFAFLQFLESKIASFHPDDESREGLEVAKECIQSSFKIDPNDENEQKELAHPESLLSIFQRNLPKEDGKEEDRGKAEDIKNQGNEYMKNGEYARAIDAYTEAILLQPRSAIYYCNRAAAYCKLDNFVAAERDCLRAIELDPKYSKAYARRGFVLSALNRFSEAVTCYKQAVQIDPSNESYRQNLELAEQKLRESELGSGGAGAGAAGSGAPPGAGFSQPPFDFGALMANPALIQMAQTVMSNPSMRDAWTGIMGQMANPSQPAPGMGVLLQAGQQMAEQLARSNPDLVQQLRQQMGRVDPADPSQPPSEADP